MTLRIIALSILVGVGALGYRAFKLAPKLELNAKFIDNVGHAFNIELPDGDIIGVSVAHVCEAKRWKTYTVSRVFKDWDLCILDTPVAGLKAYKVLKEFSGLTTGFTIMHHVMDEPMIVEGIIWGFSALESLRLKSTMPITYGASGSPVITKDGELIGAISSGFFTESDIFSIQTFITPIMPMVDLLMEERGYDE